MLKVIYQRITWIPKRLTFLTRLSTRSYRSPQADYWRQWSAKSYFTTPAVIDLIQRQRGRTVEAVCLCYRVHMSTNRFSSSQVPISTCKDSEIMSVSTDLQPPAAVRGMKELNKDLFQKTIVVWGLEVNKDQVLRVTKTLKEFLLKQPGIKPIVDVKVDGAEELVGRKLVYFDPAKVKDKETLHEKIQKFLAECNLETDSFRLCELQLTYDNWIYHDILAAILPKDSDGVAGFTTVGHIAHLNLREDVLDYKNIIGAVLLDKVASVKTVVNKTNEIDNTFRFFKMEILAGENNMITMAKENGLMFEMDFSAVYWNSRLGTEHQRVVDGLQRSDIVYDVFAGVGPFAVPAAKKRCRVIANDLNPESYRWLNRNMKLNKVKGDFNTYNMDGRDFLRTIVRDDLLKMWGISDEAVSVEASIHIIMNLPALALEFLDVFPGLLHGGVRAAESRRTSKLPTVYCYCFSKAADSKADVRERAERVIGCPLPGDHVVRFVRNVAPNKDMLCVIFRLTEELLNGRAKTLGEDETGEEPAEKRQKVDRPDVE